MFAGHESYFMHCRVLINQNQDNVKVGHPLGTLTTVTILGYNTVLLDQVIKLRDTLDPFDEFLSCFNGLFAQPSGEFLFSQPYSNRH